MSDDAPVDVRIIRAHVGCGYIGPFPAYVPDGENLCPHCHTRYVP